MKYQLMTVNCCYRYRNYDRGASHRLVEGRGKPKSGGRGGIRTHGTLAGTPVFKTGALNRSATLPLPRHQALGGREIKNGL